MELSGERVTPLVTNPGRIMLTSSRIYFQPYNNVEVVSLSSKIIHYYECVWLILSTLLGKVGVQILDY